MSFTISNNSAAASSQYHLGKNQSALQLSIKRLASGKRLIAPNDDPGSLSVAMKLNAAVTRLSGARNNVQNATSFLEVQDGVLQAGARIVDWMAELKTLSTDVMKSSQDIGNYNTEFEALQMQLHALTLEKFNGVSLFAATTVAGAATTFGTTTNTVSIFTSDAGEAGSVVSLHKSQLLAALTFNFTRASLAAETGYTTAAGATGGTNVALANASNTIEIDELGVSFFVTALENIATLRATNGATTQRLSFSEDHLRLSTTNLEAANSRIMDVDVAAESTNLAKYNILSQASAAMLAQANMAPNTALMLLG